MVYGLLTGYYSIALLLPNVSLFTHQEDSFHFIQTLSLFTLIGLMIILSFFSKYHIKILLNNKTTIETILHEETHGSYNAGFKYNFIQVFGMNKCLWPIPMYGRSGMPLGDGVNWCYAASEMSEPASELNSELISNKRIPSATKGSIFSASTRSRAPSYRGDVSINESRPMTPISFR